VRYLLDEDVNPRTAEIARGLGLDVVSVHEIGRRTLSDGEQLEFAAQEGRVLVTRNRDDFIEATLLFFRTGQPHAGVLIIPHTLPNHDSERMAHALAEWHAGRAQRGGLASYTIDFL
jgi:predicted nuclease of predicted toxin-antitoxin system